jgi:hypothetical protein
LLLLVVLGISSIIVVLRHRFFQRFFEESNKAKDVGEVVIERCWGQMHHVWLGKVALEQNVVFMYVNNSTSYQKIVPNSKFNYLW